MSEPVPHRQARRFAVCARVAFRECETSAWRMGSTVNVSHSGALFRVGGSLPHQGQRLELIFTLPLNGGTPATRVRCTGHVVRVEHSFSARVNHAVAVAIDAYALGSVIPA